MIPIPPGVADAVRTRWPRRAAEWADALPAELATVCAAFGVAPRRAYPARFAFVVHATSITTDVGLVLRSSPDPDAAIQADVLRRLAAVGVAPRVHEIRTTRTATWTVSDAVQPGTALRDATRSQHASADPVSVLRALAGHPAGPSTAPDLVPWLRSRLIAPPLDDLPPDHSPAPQHERSAALDALDAMAPPPPHRLCHGDLSPGNILIGADRLWLIDPRGINGEPAYDAAIVALKASHDDPAHARPAAAALASATGLDPDRTTAWLAIAAAARV